MESTKAYDAVAHRSILEEAAYDKRIEAKNARKEQDILSEAHAVIYGDREKTYGAPDKNLAVIARMWDAYLNRPPGTMSTSDVCNMMVLLKVARLINDPKHRDSLVDICGYTALNKRVQDYHELNGNSHSSAGTTQT